MFLRLHTKALLASAFFIVLSPVWADGDRTVDVRYVIDGDSLELANGQQVRLIGVNTPEMSGGNDQPEPLAVAARTALVDMIGKRPIRLVPGQEKKDRHARLLAYVETANGRDVQRELLADGLGFLVAIPPNIERLGPYRQAQRLARQGRRGVWADAAFAPVRAEQLNPDDPLRGFRQVRGEIRYYNASRRYHYFRLSPGFEFKVPRTDWRYFDGRPSALIGRSLTVRGWVTRGKYRLQMRVAHPAMIDFD
jgi:micrococcal nuclease